MRCSNCGANNTDDCSCVLCDSSPTVTAIATGPQTSKYAIATLVLGILSYFTNFLTSIPAVLCAIIALFKIRISKGQLKGIGFTTTGLVMIIVLPLLMHGLIQVRMVIEQFPCGANMKGIFSAINVYMHDNNYQYPDGDKWCDLLIEHTDIDPDSFQCSHFSDAAFSYGLNKNVVGLTNEKGPFNYVLLFEIKGGKNVVGGPELLYTGRHRNAGCNIVDADGYTRWVSADRLDDLKWTVEDKD